MRIRVIPGVRAVCFCPDKTLKLIREVETSLVSGVYEAESLHSGREFLYPRGFNVSLMDPGSERNTLIGQLSSAVLRLEGSMDVRLIPAGGASIVYAIRGARDPGGVAGIPGGIVDNKGVPQPAGPCAFGADEQGATAVLTAMKFDPTMRSVAILRYSGVIVRSLEGMLLECCSFDSSRGSPGLATMDWGVASCCRDGVPDVVYDKSTPDREGLVRLFGEKPDDIVNNIIILSNRIMNVEI